MKTLQEFITLAAGQPLSIEVWVSVPGCVITGSIATYDDYLAHTANPFSESEKSEGGADSLYLRDAWVIAGGKPWSVMFAAVDVKSVAAWGVGLLVD